MSSTDAAARRLPLPGPGIARYCLAWSPDGKWLAYVVGTQTTVTGELWLLRIGDGQATRVTDGSAGDSSPTWSPDARVLYFVSDRGGSTDLWQVPIANSGAEGPAVRVTAGLQVRYAALSQDGARLVYSKGRRVANLWRAPLLPDRGVTWADAQQLTFDQSFVSSWDISRDGKTLVLSSDRVSGMRLWTLPAAGGEMVPLTNGGSNENFPRWSPDGEQVVFTSSRGGSVDVWTMPAAGGAARQLSRMDGPEYLPAWSPDGKEIVFNSARTGNSDLWIVSATEGEPRQLTSDPTNEGAGVFSPDGVWIYFTSTRSGQSRLYRMPVEGGPAEPVSKDEVFRFRWLTGSRRGIFTAFRNGSPGEIFELADGRVAERPLTDLRGKRGNLGNVIASDGRFLYFSWEEDLGDLWVADLVKPNE